MRTWLVVSMLSVLVQAAAADVWGDFGYSVSAGQATITNYTGAGGHVTIPAEINGNPVVAIGSEAFRDNTALTGISFPPSVTHIGAQAFRDCIGLTSLTLPDSITTMGWSAFLGCRNLVHLQLGAGLSIIPEWAFNLCTSLSEVIIPGTVSILGTSAFGQCRSLSSVTLQNGVEVIGGDVFVLSTNLPSLHLPASINIVHGSAFQQCFALASFTLDAANTNFSLVDGVLFNSDQTVLVRYPPARPGAIYSIPPTVTVVDSNAFGSCNLLTDITIPNGVTEIRRSAFASCNGLTQLSLPDSVTLIDHSALAYCDALVNVMVGSGLETVGQWAFYGGGVLNGVHFAGNAPDVHAEAFLVSTPTVYYRAGTAGWGDTLAGRPTALWTSYPALMGQAWDAGYTDLGSNWRRLDWFGDYVPISGGWFWHNRHGYFFPTSTSVPSSIYIYTLDMGWLFTRSTLYPYLYRFSNQNWLWYLPDSHSPRWFNNLTTGQWESRP